MSASADYFITSEYQRTINPSSILLDAEEHLNAALSHAEKEIIIYLYDTKHRIISVLCPVSVTITDQYGRIIDDKGTNEIPEAYVDMDHKMFFLPTELDYTVSINADDEGNFSLVLADSLTRESASVTSFEDIPINKNAKAIMDIKSSNLNYRLNIDYDGDGTMDEIKEPETVDIAAIDVEPPITSPLLSGTTGNNGWYKSDVEVNLISTDNKGGSGINKTEYSFDNTTWIEYNSEFRLTTEGTTTLYYRSTDNEGNIESTKNMTISIDKSPPSITGAATTAPNANGWYNTNVLVHFIASDEVSGIDTLPLDQTLSGEGASQSVKETTTDKAGNSASFTVAGINIDKTSPEITINKPASEYILNEIIIVDWLTSDVLSDIYSEIGTVPEGGAVDTSSVGTKTFTVEAADNAGNSATKIVTYHVGYTYGGILQPINADGSSIFKLGSTLPVKFQLEDANGNFVTNAGAKIYLAKISSGITGTEAEATSTSAATLGNLFRYDSTSNQYIFNIGTKSLSTGTWQLRIELDDGTSKSVKVSLK